jgi:hypothetical protein
MDKAFVVADRISDRIVAILNEELAHMLTEGRLDPWQLFAGQLLGLLATLATMPPTGVPPTIVDVRRAIEACLDNIIGGSRDHVAPADAAKGQVGSA